MAASYVSLVLRAIFGEENLAPALFGRYDKFFSHFKDAECVLLTI